MIVRMQRVAVLCTASSEQETLDALQSLGVLHLDADNRSEAPALKEAQASLDNASRALVILQGVKDAPASATPPGDVRSAASPSASWPSAAISCARPSSYCLSCARPS